MGEIYCPKMDQESSLSTWHLYIELIVHLGVTKIPSLFLSSLKNPSICKSLMFLTSILSSSQYIMSASVVSRATIKLSHLAFENIKW